MDVEKRDLLTGIYKVPKSVYTIPAYQRNYDWERKQCERLMDDIAFLIKNPERKHFLGNMVIMQTDESKTRIEYTIIDGQQRITTVALLLKAIQDQAEKKGISHLVCEIGQMLRNNEGSCGYSLKLKQTPDNNEAYCALMAGCLKDDNTSNITANYTYFKARVKDFNLGELIDAINRCEIICIMLESGKDNAQLIFETLNSTGRPLTETDKIRNYLLLSDKQSLMLSQRWHELMRELFRYGHPTPAEQLQIQEDFFSTYIMSETHVISRYEDYYETFKKLCYDKFQGDKPNCLHDLERYAELYNIMMHPQVARSLSPSLREQFEELHKLDFTTCRPFIIKLLQDRENYGITDNELSNVLKTLIVYLVRRSVCGVPTAGMRKFFLTLHHRIFQYNEKRDHYADSVALFLVKQLRGTSSSFPSDDDFRKAILQGDIYHKSLCRYLLFRLENIGNEHLIDDKNITIEHILPQTPSTQWKEVFPDEEERQMLTHRIGNLTLTGDNGKLLNKPFLQKKELYRTSKATRLNDYIKQQEEWTAYHINHRCFVLSEELLLLFPTPNAIENPEIIFEKIDTITAEQSDKATKRRLRETILQNRTFEDTNFADLLVSLVQHLDREKPGRLEEVAKKVPTLIYATGSTTKYVREINSEYSIDCSWSHKSAIRHMSKLLTFYDYKPSELIFHLKPIQGEKYEGKTTLQNYRAEFWNAFLAYANLHKSELPESFRLPSPSSRGYVDIHFGRGGYQISISLNTRTQKVDVMFYMKDDKAFLYRTEIDKHRFEDEIGEQLVWHEAPKHCYIQASHSIRDNENDVVPWVLTTACKLYNTFAPLI